MQRCLESDELQFGFKKGRGYRDAIYTLCGIVSHINNSGSTTVICALDIAKAFHKMNHFGLYIKLMNRNVPRSFLDVLICWYRTLNVMLLSDGVPLFHNSFKYWLLSGRVVCCHLCCLVFYRLSYL